MKYKNANDVLPEELLALIQEYIQGDLGIETKTSCYAHVITTYAGGRIIYFCSRPKTCKTKRPRSSFTENARYLGQNGIRNLHMSNRSK